MDIFPCHRVIAAMNASTVTNYQIQGDGGITAKKNIIIIGIIYTFLVGMYFLQRPVSRFIRNILGCKRRGDHSDGMHPDTSIRFCCCAGALHRSTTDQHDGAMHISCDEREFESWTVEQVVCWIQSKLTMQNLHCSRTCSDPIATVPQPSFPFRWCSSLLRDYNQTRRIQRTVQALRDECIDGPSLEYLTFDHLLSFGIPFGMAVYLKRIIDDLLSIQSSSRRLNDATSQRSRNGTDLPMWYEAGNSRSVENTDISARASHIGEVDIEMTEGVQQIMKDRFGISLPVLRGNESPDQEPMQSTMSGEIVESIPRGHSSEQYNNNRPPVINDANFHEIWKDMPPSIRAVAERHPHLVSRLVAEKQQQQTQNNPETAYLASTATLSLLEPIREDLYEQAQDLSEPDEGFMNDEEANFDSECISLLRRRINNISSSSLSR
ncbi:hypothetical protein HJC23_013584 [Cyclotella cryptica]|uniref:SAM domain-containing protein n=1 Tax=Cyclotella cryptica TaxID=29204 RepID=A0ABD3PRC3_9STRA